MKNTIKNIYPLYLQYYTLDYKEYNKGKEPLTLEEYTKKFNTFIKKIKYLNKNFVYSRISWIDKKTQELLSEIDDLWWDLFLSPQASNTDKPSISWIFFQSPDGEYSKKIKSIKSYELDFVL